jgi:hypothetical protein
MQNNQEFDTQEFDGNFHSVNPHSLKKLPEMKSSQAVV